MGDPLFILVIVAMLTVVGALVVGIGGFGKGGAFNAKYGNKMMQLRLAAQFVAVLLIVLLIYLRREGGQ